MDIETIIPEGMLHMEGVDTTCINRDPLQYQLQYKSTTIPTTTIGFSKYIDIKHIIIPKKSIKLNSLHTRLAHINARYLLKSIKNGCIIGTDEKEIEELKTYITDVDCDSCLMGKARRSDAVEGSRDPYLNHLPFNVVYTDICQVSETNNPERPTYFVTFKCGITSYLKIYPMSNKFETSQYMEEFLQWVKNQFKEKHYRVKTIFSDQGSEYMNKKVKKLLRDQGIELHTTSTYTPASNGVAERVNLTILNDVRSMLISSKLPSYFWPEAALYSVYLRNYTWNEKLNNSPACFIGYRPLNVKTIHEFGEKCYIKILPEGSKTDIRSRSAIYLGVSLNTYGHYVFVPEAEGKLDVGNFIHSRHVSFYKHPQMYLDDSTNNYDYDLFTIFDNDITIEQVDIKPTTPQILNKQIAGAITKSDLKIDKDENMYNHEDYEGDDEEYEMQLDIADEAYSDYEMDEQDIQELQEDVLTLPNYMMSENEFADFKQNYEKDNATTSIETKFPVKNLDTNSEEEQQLIEESTCNDPQLEKPANNTTVKTRNPETNKNSRKDPELDKDTVGKSKSGKISESHKSSYSVSKAPEINTDSVAKESIPSLANEIRNSKSNKNSTTTDGIKIKKVDQTDNLKNSTKKNPHVLTTKPTQETKTQSMEQQHINSGTIPKSRESVPAHTPVPHAADDAVARHTRSHTKSTANAELTKNDATSTDITQPPIPPVKSQGQNKKPKSARKTSKGITLPPKIKRSIRAKKDNLVLDAPSPDKDNIQDVNHSTTQHDDNKPPPPDDREITKRNQAELHKEEITRQTEILSTHLPPTGTIRVRRSPRLANRTKYKVIGNSVSQQQLLLPPQTDDTVSENITKKLKIKLLKIISLHVQPTTIIKNHFPKSYKFATEGPNKDSWLPAIQNELNSHQGLGTWNSTPIVVNKNSDLLKLTIYTKWVFTIKADGSHKARLVARGDLQSDLTYDQTYSPTLRPEIARTIFAQNASNNWYFRQFDFKTAYLNSKLLDDIYIYPPQGIETPKIGSNKKVIYKLQRGIYGLKQAGRLWNEEITKTLKTLNYHQHKSFPSTFVKIQKQKVVAIIGLFVDDMIISTKYSKLIDEISTKLNKLYQMKSIEPDENGMQRFLGINLYVERNKEGKTTRIKINQNEYIDGISEKYDIEHQHRIKTPLPPGFYFDPKSKENELILNDKDLKKMKTKFKQQIGLLLYLSVMTRPDICYAVNYLAQFCEYPHPILFDMIHKLFSYLLNTQYKSLEYVYSNKKSGIICYTDSDYAQDPTSRRSMNGYLIKVNDGVVHWKSKYTALVCTSSTEAELQAIFISTNENIWLRQLNVYLGVISKKSKVRLMVDNMSIINSIQNDGFSQLSKHYSVRLMSVKERLNFPDKLDPFSSDNPRFTIEHISGELELADVLTKPVTVQVHERLIPMFMTNI